MKLQNGSTYLVNRAPGWLEVFTVVDSFESSDGTGGYYHVTDYAHVDFTGDSWTLSAKLGANGKPQGPAAVKGAVLYPVPPDVRMGVSDALILAWIQLA